MAEPKSTGDAQSQSQSPPQPQPQKQKQKQRCIYCGSSEGGRCRGRVTECVSCGRVTEERIMEVLDFFVERACHKPLSVVTPDFIPSEPPVAAAAENDEDPFESSGFITAFSTWSLERHPVFLSATASSFCGYLAELERVLRLDSEEESPNLMDNLRAYLQIIDVGEILDLDRDICDHAVQLFRDCSATTYLRNRNIEALATAALVHAIREAQEARTLQEVSVAANIQQKEIGKYIKILNDALNLSQPINSNSIAVHMPRFCSLLELDKGTQDLATYIGEMVINKCFCTRRNPISISAAAIYLACQLEDKRKTQAEICKATGLTEVTLRKVYKELIEHWKDLLPVNYTPVVAVEKTFPLTATTSARASTSSRADANVVSVNPTSLDSSICGSGSPRASAVKDSTRNSSTSSALPAFCQVTVPRQGHGTNSNNNNVTAPSFSGKGSEDIFVGATQSSDRSTDTNIRHGKMPEKPDNDSTHSATNATPPVIPAINSIGGCSFPYYSSPTMSSFQQPSYLLFDKGSNSGVQLDTNATCPSQIYRFPVLKPGDENLEMSSNMQNEVFLQAKLRELSSQPSHSGESSHLHSLFKTIEPFLSAGDVSQGVERQTARQYGTERHGFNNNWLPQYSRANQPLSSNMATPDTSMSNVFPSKMSNLLNPEASFSHGVFPLHAISSNTQLSQGVPFLVDQHDRDKNTGPSGSGLYCQSSSSEIGDTLNTLASTSMISRISLWPPNLNQPSQSQPSQTPWFHSFPSSYHLARGEIVGQTSYIEDHTPRADKFDGSTSVTSDDAGSSREGTNPEHPPSTGLL